MIEVIDRIQEIQCALWSDRVLAFKELYDKTPTNQQGDVMVLMDKTDAPPPNRPMDQQDAYTDYRCIASGNGCGKSDMSSGLIIHYHVTRPNSKILVTAASAPQLHGTLWPYMTERLAEMRKTPLGRILSNDIIKNKERMFNKNAPDSWFAMAQTADSSSVTSLMGLHAPYVAVFGDEVSGMADDCWDAVDRDFGYIETKQLMIGNPIVTKGRFFDAFHKLKEHYRTHNWSALDSEIANRAFINRMIAEHGGMDNRIVRANVLGQFSEDDEESFIKLRAVEDQINRPDVYVEEGAPVVFGVDPAYSHDHTVIAIRQGDVFFPWKTIKKYGLNPATQIVDAVAELAVTYKPAMIFVDANVYGNAIADMLIAMRLPTQKVIVQETSSLPPNSRYATQGDRLWGEMQNWLYTVPGKLWDNEYHTLAGQLTAPRFNADSGKIKIESKKDRRSRGIESTDVADAHNLTFYRPISDYYRFSRKQYGNFKMSYQPKEYILDRVGGY